MKEQIHKQEMIRFANSEQGTQVWFNEIGTKEWRIVSNPSWSEGYNYIVNDGLAESRKIELVKPDLKRDYIEIYKSEVSNSVFEELKDCKNAVPIDNTIDEWVRFYTEPKERETTVNIPLTEHDLTEELSNMIKDNTVINWEFDSEEDGRNVKIVLMTEDEYIQRRK